MIRPSHLLLLVLPLLLLPEGAVPADDGSKGLVVKKAVARFRGGGAGDSIRLKAFFSPRQVPDGFDPARDVVEVAVGPQVLVSLPKPEKDARARTKTRANGRFCYREKASREREGVRKLTLDTRRGKVSVKARRLDLAALDGAGADGVVVSLTLGDLRFSETIDFAQGRGVWRYSGPIKIPGFTPPEPAPDPSPDPDPGPGDEDFRILWTDADIHCGSGIPYNGVITDPLEYDFLYLHCTNPPVPAAKPLLTTKPAVDFSTEIVVEIYIGIRFSDGYSVT
ncbi:MAG: hypothetical protein ACYTDY_20270, partial [Planctomycetota bacterium]